MLAGACSTPTTESNVWQSPSNAGGTNAMKSIAIFAGRANNADRRTIEDGYVAALSAYGVRAAPSYTIFPQGEVPQDLSALRSALQQAGYDGALVSTLQGDTDPVHIAPGARFNGGSYGYVGPEYIPDQFVKVETTLWSPQSGKTVWSAVTETENPRTSRNFVSSLTGKVVPSLAQAGLIPPRTPVSLVP
jgi:hypothetical protein